MPRCDKRCTHVDRRFWIIWFIGAGCQEVWQHHCFGWNSYYVFEFHENVRLDFFWTPNDVVALWCCRFLSSRGSTPHCVQVKNIFGWRVNVAYVNLSLSTWNACRVSLNTWWQMNNPNFVTWQKLGSSLSGYEFVFEFFQTFCGTIILCSTQLPPEAALIIFLIA